MSYTMPLFRAIATYVDQAKSGSDKYDNALERLMKLMPSGSGIDSGTKLLLDKSSSDKLVFLVEYHHMDSNGMYCGWSSREIIITPSLTSDFNMDHKNIDYSGVDCIEVDEETGEEYDNQEFMEDSTEDHLADTFRYALDQPVEITMELFEPVTLSWHGELVKY